MAKYQNVMLHILVIRFFIEGKRICRVRDANNSFVKIVTIKGFQVALQGLNEAFKDFIVLAKKIRRHPGKDHLLKEEVIYGVLTKSTESTQRVSTNLLNNRSTR